jgi:hypothetical protein
MTALRRFARNPVLPPEALALLLAVGGITAAL